MSDDGSFVYKNAPYSPKFPNVNQTNYCWYAYIQHKVCVRKHSDETPECLQQKTFYQNLCPNQWIEDWDGQVEAGLFPGSHIWEDL